MAAPPGETDIFHHVRDFPYFHLPGFWKPSGETKIWLPEIFGFQLTKYMVLQVVAGLFVLLVFRGLARRIANGSAGRPLVEFLGNAGPLHSRQRRPPDDRRAARRSRAR